MSTSPSAVRASSSLPGTILIADDDPLLCKALQRALRRSALDVRYVTDSREVLAQTRELDPDVVLLDFMMPFQNGIETLRELHDARVDAEVVMMTAHSTGDVVVDAMRAGAYHFLNKPLEPELLHVTLAQAIGLRRMRAEARTRETVEVALAPIVGQSAGMQGILELIDRVGPTTSTVLVLGESGTGKELIARAIHERSERATKPLVAVNCAAIPHDLVESELFGHVRGAFSGALRDRAGLFESAAGGTIFLDEIGDMPLPAQAKLLRVLQEGELKRVGADETRTVDVRVIAATNVDLAARVAAGTFRRDLYYRLAVIALEVPPLRAHPEDIPLLVAHFVKKLSHRLRRPPPLLDPSAMEALVAFPWPGNVRELEHVVEHAMVLSRTGVIRPEDLSIVAKTGDTPPSSATASVRAYAEAKQRALADFDRAYVLEVLDAAKGNLSAAARLADMDRTNLRRLMRRSGVPAQALQNRSGRRR